MRARVLVALAASVTLVVGAVLAVSLSTRRQHHDSSGVVTLDVRELRPGDVLTTRYTVTKGARVFVANVPDEGFVALLGRSTHLGCRVAWVHAPGYKRFGRLPGVAFEDPCGGSQFGLNGACLDGPCPRGLDRFKTTGIGSQLRINLSEIESGAPRAARWTT